MSYQSQGSLFSLLEQRFGLSITLGYISQAFVPPFPRCNNTIFAEACAEGYLVRYRWACPTAEWLCLNSKAQIAADEASSGTKQAMAQSKA